MMCSNRKFILLFCLILALFAPTISFAESTTSPRPGTADFLLNDPDIGEEKLKKAGYTEDREAFPLAEGLTTTEDPTGDVVDRRGLVSPLTYAWGDIQKVEVKKDLRWGGYNVFVTLAEIIPTTIPEKAQLTFYADKDGNPNNNELEGVRGKTDAEFNLQYSQTDKKWNTTFRWYNAEAKAWGIDKETQMTFAFQKNIVVLHIPKNELDWETTKPMWRVGMAIQVGSQTEIDVAPSVGFPAIKEKPKNPSSTITLDAPTIVTTFQSRPDPIILVEIGLSMLIVAASLWILRKS